MHMEDPLNIERRLSREQSLLLQAALRRSPAGLEAWQAWKSRADVESLDHGSFRLLPQLYLTLESQDVDESLLPTLRGVYRSTWYRNELLLHRATPILEAFDAHEIPAVAANETGLLLTHYESEGLRPLQGLDFVVRTEDRTQAIELIRASGWRTIPRHPERRLAANQPCAFENDVGQYAFLHVSFSSDHAPRELSAALWNGAAPASLNDTTVCTLRPGDALLLACLRTLRSDETALLGGLADAATIVRCSTKLDWTRLLALTDKHELLLPVGTALTYLREQLDAPIPARVVRDLADRSVSLRDSLEYQATTGALGPAAALVKPWLLYRYYTRSRPPSREQRSDLSFPRYLQYRWQVARGSDLPRYVLARVLDALRPMARSPQH